jgi:phosphate transport system permease protein
MKKKIKSQAFYLLIWVAAGLTLAALLILIGYILVNGLPHIDLTFLTQEPSKMGSEGGILSVIVGTLYVTAVAVAIATPASVAGAVYFTEYAREGRTVRTIRFFTEVLAGIPSIIFGLFGFAFFVVFLKMGWSILAGGLTLAIMILPTILRATEEALKTVPLSYREGSLALGAGKWYTIRKVVLPSCRNGIITGVILGLGRAIGETAAVVLTIGGSLNMPVGLFDSTRTMSVHLYLLASEGLSREKTFATAALLIIIVLIINTVANTVGRRPVNG